MACWNCYQFARYRQPQPHRGSVRPWPRRRADWFGPTPVAVTTCLYALLLITEKVFVWLDVRSGVRSLWSAACHLFREADTACFERFHFVRCCGLESPRAGV